MPPKFCEDRKEKTTYVKDEELVGWWRKWNDPVLDRFLEEALQANFDYRIALEHIRQARYQNWIQFTQLLPDFIANGQASRFRTSQSFLANSAGAGGGGGAAAGGASGSSATPTPTPTTPTIPATQSFFQVGLDAIWQIDLFGGLRRASESSYYQWQATDAEARAVKITILSEVAITYATIRSYQHKKELAQQIVDADSQLLEISNARHQSGLIDAQEIETVRAALEGNRATLKVLDTALKQNIYSLATLLGRQPETLPCEFESIAPIPSVGALVPTSLPAELLRRRPDIERAERELAAATAEIGVAVAELFPKVSLTGSSSSFAANPLQGANVGFASDHLNKLFDKPSRIWGIGGLVTLPIFDFGKRQTGVKLQESVRRENYLAYQKAVILALQETEEAMAAYFNEEERHKALAIQVQSFEKKMGLTQDLYQAGVIDYSQYLQSRVSWLTAMNTLVDSQQLQTTDLIAVYRALGGEW